MSAFAITPPTSVAEDRTRDQWTAEILYHPAGKPGHVYTAQVVARIRGNDLADVASQLATLAATQPR